MPQEDEKKQKVPSLSSFRSATSVFIITAHIASFDISIYTLLYQLSSEALRGFDP